MSKAKAGRKRKIGSRYPSGKLRPAYDYGCEGVIRRRATYGLAIPANDTQKAKRVDDHTFDAIGRAWSAGLLQADGCDPEAMRDAGRDLGSLYWRIYGLATPDSLARFQVSTAGMSSAQREASLEGALTRKLEAINAVGRAVRMAIDAVCIGDGSATDSGPVWLDRIIWSRRYRKPVGDLDQAMLSKVNKGLAQIV